MSYRDVLVSPTVNLYLVICWQYFYHTFGFHDTQFQPLERRDEPLSRGDPYTQALYDQDLEARNERNDRVCCVYISNVFDDRTNFENYIKGT